LDLPLSLFVQLLVNGVMVGGVYALAALGLSLIWGVMKVVNVAHGDLIMISAFATYWIFAFWGINPLLSMALTLPLGFVIGVVLYKLLIDRLVERAEHDLMTLVLTLGISSVVYGFAAYTWGSDIRSIPILLPTFSAGVVDLPGSRASTFVVGIALVALTYHFLMRTYMGKAIRAVAQNRNAAMLVGIDPRKVFTISFGLGTAFAMVSGSLITLTNPGITPNMGLDFLLKCFAIVVLGGLGNPVGALVGGLVLGIAESVSSLFVRLTATVAVSFGILIIVIIFKPDGLFGSLR